MNSEELIFDYSHNESPQKSGSFYSEDCLAGFMDSSDIYELATDIGHDFEKLVQLYGYDTFSGVLPKVVHTLESLESCYKKIELSQSKMTDMRQTILALEKERNQRNNDRLKFENDVEEMETQWRHEKADLMLTVRRLQEENLSLQKEIQRCNNSVQIADVHSREASPVYPAAIIEQPEKNHKVISELQEKNIRLKQDLVKTNDECNELKAQMQRLTRQNTSFMEKMSNLKLDIDQILEEKTELEAQLATDEKKVQQLTISLNALRQKEKDELELTQLTVLKQEAPRISSVLTTDPVRFSASCDVVSHSVFERHFSVEEASTTATPLPDLNLSESEERVVYGPINREPEDKLEASRPLAANKSIRDFFERMFSKFSDKKVLNGFLASASDPGAKHSGVQ